MNILALLHALPDQLEPRPTQIHRHYCKHCPSGPGRPMDEEAAEYATYPHAERVELVFPCAWRPQKMCKGICEHYGVSERDLAR